MERPERSLRDLFSRSRTRPEAHPLERARNELYIRRFDLPDHVRREAEPRDLEVLDSVVKAAEAIEPIYARQDSADERAHFYPRGVRRSRIDRAARTNPEISSPYSVVIEEDNGKLATRRTIDVFRNELQPVIRHLNEAANRTRDQQFRQYLRIKAASFQTGDFEAADRAWLSIDHEPTVDLLIGLYDNYTDKFMKRKFSFEAWAGLYDKASTDETRPFFRSFLDWRQRESGLLAPDIDLRIDQTVIQSGQAAKYEWVANSMPCQQEWRVKYGSKFTVFKPAFDDKFNDRLEAYRTVIDPNKRMGSSDVMIKRASFRRVIAHEIGHSLMSRDIDDRLGDYSSLVKELYCDVLSLKGYYSIATFNPESRLALATYFADGAMWYKDWDRERKKMEYYVSNSTVLNYCIQNSSVQVEDSHITWQNIGSVFKDISDLYNLVDRLQREGKKIDAERFFGQYFDKDVYKEVISPRQTTPSLFRNLTRGENGKALLYSEPQELPSDQIVDPDYKVLPSN